MAFCPWPLGKRLDMRICENLVQVQDRGTAHHLAFQFLQPPQFLVLGSDLIQSRSHHLPKKNLQQSQEDWAFEPKIAGNSKPSADSQGKAIRNRMLRLAIHHASLHGVKTLVFHQIHSSCHLAKALELIVVGGSEDKVASLCRVDEPGRAISENLNIVSSGF